MWIEILKKEVQKKGPEQVAKELGISRPAVDLVLKGTYGASTKNILKKVENIYGRNGSIVCENMGAITPNACAEMFAKAKRVGLGVGSPETLRQHYACLNCDLRRRV